QQDMADFIAIEFSRIGADTHITPREVIRDFIEVLDIVYQNPKVKVAELLGSDRFTYAQNPVLSEETGEQFAEFTLQAPPQSPPGHCGGASATPRRGDKRLTGFHMGLFLDKVPAVTPSVTASPC